MDNFVCFELLSSLSDQLGLLLRRGTAWREGGRELRGQVSLIAHGGAGARDCYVIGKARAGLPDCSQMAGLPVPGTHWEGAVPAFVTAGSFHG